MVEVTKGARAIEQISFAAAEYAGKRKKTRREVFLEEMEQVVPWKALMKLIEPFCPAAGRALRAPSLRPHLRCGRIMPNLVDLS